MPTIRDVAKKLDISITTVSRALDGYDDVSEETRQRVIEAAREMGYVPNRAARQLRRRRTDTIGYIVPAEKPQFADPFFAEFIAGLGGNGTIIGSTANVVVASLSERTRSPITSVMWNKRGLPVMLATLTVTTILYILAFPFLGK